MISITDAEAHVMQALWRRHPQEAREIAEELAKEKGWRRTTVNTLISRLEKKGAITVQEGSSPKRYVPAIETAEYGRAVTRRLVDMVFDGRIAPLVASFAGDKKLPPEQLEELKALVEAMSDDES
jgi:predicted transcriptional regulator